MKPTAIIRVQHYQAPCGVLILGEYNERLCLCDWSRRVYQQTVTAKLVRNLRAMVVDEPTAILQKAAKELDEYFEGNRRAFDLPLFMAGTPFQQQVWNVLLKVPYGETRSYSWVAREIGNPKAVRAVGLANGANPMSIFVPCHRIIGSNHTLTGYGGGLDVKEFLLNCERIS